MKMDRRLLAALLLAACALAGCETYPGPTADCFAFADAGHPCDFRPLAGAEGTRP